METRWTLEGGGELFCREEDGRLRFLARGPAASDGLYKVWLRGGNGGCVLLGTLVPERGVQTLTRTLSRDELDPGGLLAPCGWQAGDGLFLSGGLRRVAAPEGGGCADRGPGAPWVPEQGGGPALPPQGRGVPTGPVHRPWPPRGPGPPVLSGPGGPGGGTPPSGVEF